MEFAKELNGKAVIVVAFYGCTILGELPNREFVTAKSNAGNLHMWRIDM